MKITISTGFTDELIDDFRRAKNPTEHLVAQQIAKDTEPYVPYDTGETNAQTEVRDNMVIYKSPPGNGDGYIWYLYYGKYMVDEAGHGPMHIVNSDGNEVIRYPKGSKLHATDKDLVFTQAVHGQAQSHWLEASEAQNIDKWVRVAGEGLTKFVIDL